MQQRLFITLTIIILTILIIIILCKTKIIESFEFRPYFGRDPNKFNCCGNMDWYLADEYQKYCPGVTPTAFVNVENIEGFEVKTEMTAKDAYIGNLEYHIEDDKCKKMNKNWKSAYNPSICIQDGKLISEANCQCIDKNNDCVKCYKKIDLSKYLQ